MLFKKRKFKVLTLFLTCLAFSCIGCGKKEQTQTAVPVTATPKEQTQAVVSVPNLHNGDAKFYNQLIITTLDGKLMFLDLDGNIVHKYNDISANWVDSIEDEGIVIYGNFNRELGIAKFDTDGQLISNQIIMKTENLQIDPAIIKANGHYYATATEIEGCINNADSTVENGQYTIHLYQSDDLTNWTSVCDVLSKKNNLEDVKIFYQNQNFYIIYEEESVDKGNSFICMIESKDGLENIQWNEPKTLLSNDCDHEPANVLPTEDGYILYYSCDKENPGSSYMGAKMYYALFDKDFKLLKQDETILSPTQKGILLYDVKVEENQCLYLFAGNYLSDCDLIVEKSKIFAVVPTS